MSRKIHVARNSCNCHPETCGCNPFAIFINGDKVATGHEAPLHMLANLATIGDLHLENERLKSLEKAKESDKMKDLRERTRGPGKFEGEPVWVPYFYDLMTQGEGEEISPPAPEEDPSPEGYTTYTAFEADADEERLFGLVCGHTILIWEDGNGFVHGRTFCNRRDAEVWAEGGQP